MSQPENTTVKQVLFEMVFLAAALAAVGFFMENTAVMSALIGVNIAARFVFIRRRHDWIFFLIGVVAGGGNDLLSMIKGVYYYTPEHLLPAPIPIWMLVFWGHIFVAFRQLFQLRAFGLSPVPDPPWKIDRRIVADLLTVIVLRIIIYNFVKQEPVPAIGYAAVVALRLIVVPPKRNEWLLMAVVVPLGVGYEAALIGLGLYVYFDTVFLGMPAWLIIYWTFMLPLFIKGVFDRIEVALAGREGRGSVPAPTGGPQK